MNERTGWIRVDDTRYRHASGREVWLEGGVWCWVDSPDTDCGSCLLQKAQDIVERMAGGEFIATERDTLPPPANHSRFWGYGQSECLGKDY